MKRYSIAALVLIFCSTIVMFLFAFAVAPQETKTDHYNLQVEELVSTLDHPWSLAFLPDGQLLITERPGRMLIISTKTQQRTVVNGLPAIAAHGQGGCSMWLFIPISTVTAWFTFPTRHPAPEESAPRWREPDWMETPSGSLKSYSDFVPNRAVVAILARVLSLTTTTCSLSRSVTAVNERELRTSMTTQAR